MTLSDDESATAVPGTDSEARFRQRGPSAEDFRRAIRAHREQREIPSGSDPSQLLFLPFAFQWRRELALYLDSSGIDIRLTNLRALQDRFLGFLWRRAGHPVRGEYPVDNIDDAFLARFGVRREGEGHESVARKLGEELASFRREMPRWWRLLGEVTARSSLFVARVARQSAAMSARLGGADSASPLTISLEPWKSDPHDGNRTVVRVAFDARGLWYYKPRALDMETVMDELMGRAREIFPELFPEVLPALHVAGQEGWMQAVGPCRDLPERLHADYFQHAGALLALVRSVGGMDFYRDNLVSDADGWLVPVDSECLFSDETLDGGGPAGILESGILPISSRRLGPRVAGITTGFLDVPDARLREILHRGAPFVEAGFRRCRLALARHVSAWLEEKDLRLRWSSLRRRRLRVGTLGYYTAIERALSPANLVDDSSWRGSLRRHLEEVSPGPRENPAEMEFDVEDLSQLDIPHWTEALAEGGGAVFERLSKRLGCVDERWVDEECRILVASLTGKIAERS